MKVIVAYKFAKGAAELAAAGLLAAFALAGSTGRFHRFAVFFRRHVTSVWSLSAAQWALSEATPRHIRIACLALALDGLLGAIEGIGLYRGYGWGPWLVLLATGAPLPLEAARILRHPAAGRILILAANLLIVGYLLVQARRFSEE